jgi:hypothetical protein
MYQNFRVKSCPQPFTRRSSDIPPCARSGTAAKKWKWKRNSSRPDMADPTCKEDCRSGKEELVVRFRELCGYAIEETGIMLLSTLLTWLAGG